MTLNMNIETISEETKNDLRAKGYDVVDLNDYVNHRYIKGAHWQVQYHSYPVDTFFSEDAAWLNAFERDNGTFVKPMTAQEMFDTMMAYQHKSSVNGDCNAFAWNERLVAGQEMVYTANLGISIRIGGEAAWKAFRVEAKDNSDLERVRAMQELYRQYTEWINEEVQKV